MRRACVSFGGGSLKVSVLKGLPPEFRVPPEIQQIASAFFDLQLRRHLADYDFNERFERSDVLILIGDAHNCINGFIELPTSDEKRFFLACLWAWNGLTER
jgi:hypothetical protein